MPISEFRLGKFFLQKSLYILELKYILDKMEIAITKISSNGQIVIPSEIRKDAKIEPSTKFLVFNEGGNILLKQLNEESLIKNLKLIEQIEKGEEDIKEGKFIVANTNMDAEEIDDLLMS
jgi:AbrB family looped-hinge helix DNA binding protein